SVQPDGKKTRKEDEIKQSTQSDRVTDPDRDSILFDEADSNDNNSPGRQRIRKREDGRNRQCQQKTKKCQQERAAATSRAGVQPMPESGLDQLFDGLKKLSARPQDKLHPLV